MCWDTTSRGPRTYQLLWNNSVLAGDSPCGPLGHFTFLYGLKKDNRRSGRKRTKNKRTIWACVNSKCKKGKFVALHSLCICRLSLTCSFREISTRLLGMPTHLVCLPHCPWTLSHADWSLLLSIVDCPSASPFINRSFWVPFSNSFSGVPLPTALASLGLAFPRPLPVLSEISIPSPLFGFAPRHTKGSSS